MNKAVLVVVTALVTGSAWSEDQLPATGPLPEVKDSGIGYPSPEAALDALRKKPGVKISEKQGWTIVEDQEAAKSFTLWSFVPLGHRAYPAAVKRTTFEKDGALYIDMKVKCGGTKEACDALVRDFQALNDRMKAQMNPSNQ